MLIIGDLNSIMHYDDFSRRSLRWFGYSIYLLYTICICIHIYIYIHIKLVEIEELLR